MMKVVVIGSGGREHSIVWKLSLDNRVKNIYTFTDNSGIVALSNFSEPLNNLETIIDKVLEINPDIVVKTNQQELKEIFAGLKNVASISLALTNGSIDVKGGKVKFLQFLGLFTD